MLMKINKIIINIMISDYGLCGGGQPLSAMSTSLPMYLTAYAKF